MLSELVLGIRQDLILGTVSKLS